MYIDLLIEVIAVLLQIVVIPRVGEKQNESTLLEIQIKEPMLSFNSIMGTTLGFG
jgi:hypothetical protein